MTTHLSDHGSSATASPEPRILVGDMLVWSDLDSLDAPLRGAREIVRQTVERQRPRRVLLAGPRAGLLIGAVPTDVAVDLLVRSLPDARTLATWPAAPRGGPALLRWTRCLQPGPDLRPRRRARWSAASARPRLAGARPSPRRVERLSSAARRRRSPRPRPRQRAGIRPTSCRPCPTRRCDSDAGWHVGADRLRHPATSSPTSAPPRSRSGRLQLLTATYAALPSIDHHRLLVRDSRPGGGAPSRRPAGAAAGPAMDERPARRRSCVSPRRARAHRRRRDCSTRSLPRGSSWRRRGPVQVPTCPPYSSPMLVAAEPGTASCGAR